MNQDFILIVFGALEISFLNAVKSLKEIVLNLTIPVQQATPLKKVSVNDLKHAFMTFQ